MHEATEGEVEAVGAVEVFMEAEEATLEEADILLVVFVEDLVLEVVFILTEVLAEDGALLFAHTLIPIDIGVAWDGMDILAIIIDP